MTSNRKSVIATPQLSDRRMKGKHLESTLVHFGVFIVKVQPLLHNAADAGLGVVDELEASDVRPTFPQVCQVDVQETLKTARRTGKDNVN